MQTGVLTISRQVARPRGTAQQLQACEHHHVATVSAEMLVSVSHSRML